MEIENKNTFERCLLEGINLFTGSGFSLLSEDKSGQTLPVGDELRKELLTIFPGTPNTLELPQLCTLISRTKREKLDEYIRFRFNVDKFNDDYKNLEYIEIKNVFTTNVDNLFQAIFRSSGKKYVNDINFNGVSFHEKQAIDYIYLHGSVVDPYSQLVFGDLDIASAFSNDPSRWNYFKQLMNKYPTLFWGYALKDAGTLQVFADSLNDHNRKNSWIIIHPDYVMEGEIDYYRSLDLKIIKSDTKKFLGYIGSFSTRKKDTFNHSQHPLLEYAVPTQAEVEHRSIQDFFQGANPRWSDIYSPRVVRTRYYDDIVELLNQEKNVLLTGGPATGKSTLLMQLAAFFDYKGVKIFTSNISIEKAHTVIVNIKDSPAILFVDNFQTSLEALKILSKHKNTRLVIAERDYAYLSSSSANFLRKNTEVIDITELNDMDVQAIIDNIPIDIKSNHRYSRNEGDSLFELIEKNCTTPSIKNRFNNVINELRKKDPLLVQLFLLICYLHTCRSIASMDILINYFGKSVNYTQIYNLISILSSSIAEYVGNLADNGQDYFNIRSNLLAEHISSIAPTKDLALMLKAFHNNVSRYNVPNFDAFKRQAYDARLFEKAFPEINDGVQIYDVIYKRYQSPFNLQQKALYLSRRGAHQQAFIAIDEAISKTGTKNWSIKNSYAIIKFRANIDRDNTPDVRKALDESMGALEQCHTSDIRKAFHAMSYADHALQYWKKYRDEKSLYYLENAKIWLSEEKDRDNRIRNVSRLLNSVRRALSISR